MNIDTQANNMNNELLPLTYQQYPPASNNGEGEDISTQAPNDNILLRAHETSLIDTNKTSLGSRFIQSLRDVLHTIWNFFVTLISCCSKNKENIVEEPRTSLLDNNESPITSNGKNDTSESTDETIELVNDPILSTYRTKDNNDQATFDTKVATESNNTTTNNGFVVVGKDTPTHQEVPSFTLAKSPIIDFLGGTPVAINTLTSALGTVASATTNTIKHLFNNNTEVYLALFEHINNGTFNYGVFTTATNIHETNEQFTAELIQQLKTHYPDTDITDHSILEKLNKMLHLLKDECTLLASNDNTSNKNEQENREAAKKCLSLCVASIEKYKEKSQIEVSYNNP